MRLTNHYYKYYKKFHPDIRSSADSVRVSRVIKHANLKKDYLKVTKYDVLIEEDFIKKIEEGLVFVEKAILEDRRFIRHEGETLLIEKVKKTSRETVEHLSRHTNLITKKPDEGERIIPDKLYIVEKLHDYAVYENRFLYLLLYYLNDFLYMRIDKIKNKLTTYEAEMHINKEIRSNNRTINYELNISDVYNNDPYLTTYHSNNELLERMTLVYYYVEALLKTELMREVSKAPLLKPPIVKTNVLRMNPNFKQSVDLYEYIMAYSKDGYEFIEKVNTYNPFDNKLSEDVALSIEFQTFLVYKYGNEIEKDLELAYLKDLELEKAKQEKLELLEIERLKRRVKELNLDFEQYILILEKRNNKLELGLQELNKIKGELEQAKDEIVELNQTIKQLNQNITNLTNKLEEKIAEIAKLIEDYELEISTLIEMHEEDILEINEAHKQEIINIEQAHLEEKNEIISKYEQEKLDLINKYEFEKEKIINNYETEIENIKLDHQKIINNINEKHAIFVEEKDLKYQKMVLKKDSEYDELNKKYLDNKKTLEKEIKELKQTLKAKEKAYLEEVSSLTESSQLSKALLYSFKEEHNIDEVEDFTSREKFKELEQIRKTFNKFFKSQWRKTKMQIKAKVKLESEEILKTELEEKANKKKSKKKKK